MQFLKALFGIVVTFSPIVIFVRLFVLNQLLIVPVQFSALKFNVVSPLQPKNA